MISFLLPWLRSPWSNPTATKNSYYIIRKAVNTVGTITGLKKSLNSIEPHVHEKELLIPSSKGMKHYYDNSLCVRACIWFQSPTCKYPFTCIYSQFISIAFNLLATSSELSLRVTNISTAPWDVKFTRCLASQGHLSSLFLNTSVIWVTSSLASPMSPCTTRTGSESISRAKRSTFRLNVALNSNAAIRS